jgi:hypothetical protein
MRGERSPKPQATPINADAPEAFACSGYAIDGAGWAGCLGKKEQVERNQVKDRQCPQ